MPLSGHTSLRGWIGIAVIAGALIAPALAAAQSDHLAAELAGGRVVLRDIRFRRNSDELEPSSLAPMKRLAKAINATPGTFLIEGHVAASGDTAKDHALSERRAVAVKATLVLEGVPPPRIVTIGYGATRPLAERDGRLGSSARIEVARVQ